MNRVKVLSGLIILALAGASVFLLIKYGAHQTNSNLTEGVYDIYLGLDSIWVGQLELSQGQYSFIPQNGVEQVLKSAESRLFFIPHPQGIYRIEYSDLPESNNQVDILATIVFAETDVEAAEILSRRSSEVGQIFLIRQDQQNMKLFFHSLNSEIQLWRVEKSGNLK